MQKMYVCNRPEFYKKYHSGDTRQEVHDHLRSNLCSYLAADPVTGIHSRARVTCVPARHTDPFNGNYLLTATKESRDVSVIGTDKRQGPDIVVTRVTVDGATQTPYDYSALRELIDRSNTAGGHAAIRFLTFSPEGQRLLQAAGANGWIVHAIADTFAEIDVAHQSQRSATEVCAAFGRHAIIVSTPIKPATNILPPQDFPLVQVVDYVQGIIADFTATGIFEVTKSDVNCHLENGILHTQNSYLPNALPTLADATKPETWSQNVRTHSGNPVVGEAPLDETFHKLLNGFEAELAKGAPGIEFAPDTDDSDFNSDHDLCDTDTSVSSAGATTADSEIPVDLLAVPTDSLKPIEGFEGAGATAEDTGPQGRRIRLANGFAHFHQPVPQNWPPASATAPATEEFPGLEGAPKRDHPEALSAQVARKRTNHRSGAPPAPTNTAGAASTLWQEQRQDLSVGPKPPAVKSEPSPLDSTATLAACLPPCPPPPPPSGPPPLAASLEHKVKGNHRSCQILQVPGSQTTVVVHSEKIGIGIYENTLHSKELGVKVIFNTESPYRIRQRDYSTAKSQSKIYRDTSHLIAHFQHQAAENIAGTVQVAATTTSADTGLLTAGDYTDSLAAKDKFQCQLAHAAICQIFSNIAGTKPIIDRHNHFA